MSTWKLRFFSNDKCNLCGTCLSECQVLNLPRDLARGEIKLLIEGIERSYTLSKCISCFTCDVLCPEGCNPYELILYNKFESIRRRGMPLRVRYMLPHRFPNFRSVVIRRLPPEDRRTILEWVERTRRLKIRGKEVIYAGCNLMTLPYLTYTKLLDGIPVIAAPEICCGEMYYRMGMLDLAFKAATMVEDFFRKIDVRTVLFLCTGCYDMLSKIYPSRFGIDIGAEMHYLTEWLWEQGRVDVKRKIRRTITVQDSCHAKILGDEFMEGQRRILEGLGLEIVEMKNAKMRAMCCGLGYGVRRYNIFDLVYGILKRLREARETGAEILVPYCLGCLITQSGGMWLYRTGMQIYHVMDFLRCATGERPVVRHKEVGKYVVQSIIYGAIPDIFSRKRFYVEQLWPFKEKVLS
ncbi:MAG: (Fe-S)-binding protein [Candidatus Baldrarchaeia archaeon]